MKIVPCTSVDLLRWKEKEEFPNPWEATDEQLESVLYVAEIWDSDGELVHVDRNHMIVVSFDEIKKSFDEWDQDSDEFMEEDEHYNDVHDYIRDCIDHGYHPCRLT